MIEQILSNIVNSRMFEQRDGGLLSIVNFAHSVSPNFGALRDMTSKAVIIIQRLPILHI